MLAVCDFINAILEDAFLTAMKKYDTMFETNIDNLKSQMINMGYTYQTYYSNNCIVAYYRNGENYIRHFSKITNGVVTAKMDSMELVVHENYQAYGGMSTGFGDRYLFFVK